MANDKRGRMKKCENTPYFFLCCLMANLVTEEVG
jgi:hypothetical protein